MTAPLVIKVGGNDLSKPGFVEALAHTVSQISQPCVLVHGGGRTVDDLLSKLEIVPQYVNGQRVTDEATLEVVEMVLSGQACSMQALMQSASAVWIVACCGSSVGRLISAGLGGLPRFAAICYSIGARTGSSL
jgi:acetylglutamate kinase